MSILSACRASCFFSSLPHQGFCSQTNPGVEATRGLSVLVRSSSHQCWFLFTLVFRWITSVLTLLERTDHTNERPILARSVTKTASYQRQYAFFNHFVLFLKITFHFLHSIVFLPVNPLYFFCLYFRGFWSYSPFFFFSLQNEIPNSQIPAAVF